MTDPIADFLTRIRNAYLAKQQNTLVPYSNIKYSLAKLLKSSGYISDVKIIKSNPFNNLSLKLRYIKNMPAVTGIQRVSKPGRRLYVRSNKIRPVLSGQGISIISTSKGLVIDKTARKQSLGGEFICRVW